jgi:hypothetical protein
MIALNWSAHERKVARSAFEAALSRELAEVRREIESILRSSGDPTEIWRVRDYLNEKAREIDHKYDFRYSVLIGVFAQLIAEGWLAIEELAGMDSEKLDLIRERNAVRKQIDA